MTVPGTLQRHVFIVPEKGDQGFDMNALRLHSVVPLSQQGTHKLNKEEYKREVYQFLTLAVGESGIIAERKGVPYFSTEFSGALDYPRVQPSKLRRLIELVEEVITPDPTDETSRKIYFTFNAFVNLYVPGH
jgi:hypothetical protein